MRILGIDPGSRVTGWGVVDCDGWELTYVAAGAVRTDLDTDSLAVRLRSLAVGLKAVVAEVAPDVAAVEKVFAARNARSALVLGHARGVALVVAAEAGLPVFEYQPTQVKNAVCGNGRADKHQVRDALVTQLALRRPPRPLDASDALAVACCHAGAARLADHLARLGAQSAGGAP